MSLLWARLGPLLSRLSWLLSNSLKMAVPAGIYLAMNMLGFVSLHRIDAGTAIRVHVHVHVCRITPCVGV